MSHSASPETTPYTPAYPVHGARNIKLVQHEMTPADRIYLVEAIRGIGVTFKHFFVNLGTLLAGRPIETVQYPEEKRPYADRFRAQHRLLRRGDGTPRCVACFMCATACPAYAIHIVAMEREGSTEKAPRVFEIDELRCVDCGLCVEACPCDAIRMDTGLHPVPTTTREATLLDREALLALDGKDDGPLPWTARTAELQRKRS